MVRPRRHAARRRQPGLRQCRQGHRRLRTDDRTATNAFRRLCRCPDQGNRHRRHAHRDRTRWAAAVRRQGRTAPSATTVRSSPTSTSTTPACRRSSGCRRTGGSSPRRRFSPIRSTASAPTAMPVRATAPNCASWTRTATTGARVQAAVTARRGGAGAVHACRPVRHAGGCAPALQHRPGGTRRPFRTAAPRACNGGTGGARGVPPQPRRDHIRRPGCPRRCRRKG